MSEQLRMLFVIGIAVTLMIISVNISTHANESKFLKEDIEVAIHDASLKVNKESLSNGFISFNQDEAIAAFEETLEINTGLVNGEDYSIEAFEFFDHSTHEDGFRCEHASNPTYEFDYGSQDFIVSCPSILAIVSYESNGFITMAGNTPEGKEIVKGAAYSYELDPAAIGEVEGAVFADLDMANLSMMTASLNLGLDLTRQGDYYWPVPYTKNITSHFQPNRVNPVTGIVKDHNGTDIALNGIENEPTVSIADGVVTYVGAAGGYGNVVEVNHGDGLVTRYAHLNSILVSNGDVLSGGDVVGLVGNTGNSTGPHLHFEVMQNGSFINPLLLFD